MRRRFRGAHFSTAGKIGIIALIVFWIAMPALNLFDIEIWFTLRRRFHSSMDVVVFFVLVVVAAIVSLVKNKSLFYSRPEEGRGVLDGDALVIALILMTLGLYIWQLLS